MSSKKSEVWIHFEKHSSEEATCRKCGNNIKCKGSSTTPLINHLKRHEIYINKRTSNQEETTSVKSSKIVNSQQILKFVKRESLGELLAKCAAKDGFSIHAITNSSAIREFIHKRGFEMPRSRNTVKKLIIQFYEQKREELKNNLNTRKNNEQKFSITVDEWTDINMKRYMNVTLHSKSSCYKLGLAKIDGSCDAEKTKKIVEDKLLEFGIQFSDIVASTHDGAAVMQKYGRNISAINQLCYNHAIHLAVIRVFYKKTGTVTTSDDENKSEFDEQSEYDSDSDYENSDIEHENMNLGFDNTGVNNIPMRQDINVVISESRRLIKFFKFSAVRKNVLQKYIMEQEKKELHLLLDCKTRWNSLVPMIERLLKLKKCIKQSLIDLLGTEKEYYNEQNFVILENILNILKPLELGVKELSNEQATLLSSEGVFKFMFKKLNDIDSDLSNEMLTSLKTEFLKRRNKEVVSLMKFLQNSSISQGDNFDDITYASKPAIYAYAKETMSRLYVIPEDENHVSTSGSEDEICEPITLVMELKKSISSMSSKNPTKFQKNNFDSLQKEFKLLEGNGKLTHNLEKLLNALNTIQPTSTSSERVFSVAGTFSTKLRSRLQFPLLNALVFLKYYFNNE